jgi:hypothetical protein
MDIHRIDLPAFWSQRDIWRKLGDDGIDLRYVSVVDGGIKGIVKSDAYVVNGRSKPCYALIISKYSI